MKKVVFNVFVLYSHFINLCHPVLTFNEAEISKNTFLSPLILSFSVCPGCISFVVFVLEREVFHHCTENCSSQPRMARTDLNI